MPFEKLITTDDEADIRQALGDVASATFGQHPVTWNRKTLTPGAFGESPVETDDPISLKGLVISPIAAEKVNSDRAQIDWDAQVMFYRDYLDEEGYLSLMEPDAFNRAWTWTIDNVEYRTQDLNWQAQFVEDYLILFVNLKRV